jgi:hypothetical protein
MAIVSSKFNAQIGSFLHGRSYWAVKLENGDWLSDIDENVVIRRGERRNLEWHDDIVANGDAAHIKELWLFCPPHPINPLGANGRLPILEPWSCFVMNGRQMNIGTGHRYTTYQIVGRVTDKVSGDCDCFIWDALEKKFYHGQNNVYKFTPWRPGAAPLGLLALDTLGLRLS